MHNYIGLTENFSVYEHVNAYVYGLISPWASCRQIQGWQWERTFWLMRNVIFEQRTYYFRYSDFKMWHSHSVIALFVAFAHFVLDLPLRKHLCLPFKAIQIYSRIIQMVVLKGKFYTHRILKLFFLHFNIPVLHKVTTISSDERGKHHTKQLCK